MTERELALHRHYARNAAACGHRPTCEKVTADRNWPTIMGRPRCTCGQESSVAALIEAQP
jgi:hypothetical protein